MYHPKAHGDLDLHLGVISTCVRSSRLSASNPSGDHRGVSLCLQALSVEPDVTCILTELSKEGLVLNTIVFCQRSLVARPREYHHRAIAIAIVYRPMFSGIAPYRAIPPKIGLSQMLSCK